MIWGLADMLARGYVVVATDYPGLGVPGQIHPYLIGVSEARAVLDSVRAARALPRTGASNRFAVWGHSQGGHASLYTGELAASYAPELKLVGVAATAPATYLAELFDADKTTSTGKEMTAMTIYSWSKLYNIPISNLVEPAAMRPYQAMAHDCIESLSQFAAIEKAAKPLEQVQFLKADPTEIEPWRGIMQKNTPGQAPAGRVHRPRHGRHHREAGDHQAIREASVQTGVAGAFAPASRREPYLRRQEQRGPGARVDERPLPRRAGALRLRPLAPAIARAR